MAIGKEPKDRLRKTKTPRKTARNKKLNLYILDHEGNLCSVIIANSLEDALHEEAVATGWENKVKDMIHRIFFEFQEIPLVVGKITTIDYENPDMMFGGLETMKPVLDHVDMKKIESFYNV